MTALRAALYLLVVVIAWTMPAAAQEYPSSVVGTDFDFITESDPSAFHGIEFKGLKSEEMPDKTTRDAALMQPAFVFGTYYTDGTQVKIAVDSTFRTAKAAHKEAMRYASRLGKLPTALRKGVKRLVVHQGEKNSTAFSDVGLIVVYSANATKRISTHDLEETIFHESVHAAWDKQHARSAAWLKAQAADGAFITSYARRKRTREDLAESALFAYTLLHHPKRIPAADAKKIGHKIAARIDFVEALLPPKKSIFYNVAPVHKCDDSASPKNLALVPPAMESPKKNPLK